MGRRKQGTWPKYCGPHKLSGLAYVWHNGKQVYFPGSPHGTGQSHAAYEKFCREHYDNAAVVASPSSLSVAYVLCQYLEKKPQRGSEKGHYEALNNIVIRLYGNSMASAFGPLALQAVRDAFVDAGWSRTYVNSQVFRLRRIFKWAVSQEIVKPETLIALQTVTSLAVGQTKAPETEPVKPVAWEHVEAVINILPATVSAMLSIQWWTGMRSANLCEMCWEQIDQSNDVWLFIPQGHKTSWRGIRLVIPLGPKCQKVLSSFLERDPKLPIFSPAETMRLVVEARKKKRVKRDWKQVREYQPTTNRLLTDRYDSRTYRQAIRYGIDAVNKSRLAEAKKQAEAAGVEFKPEDVPQVPYFHPHQLRHSRATHVREKFGVEAAQVYLGHANASVTQLYAERDLSLALKVARDIG